MIKAKKYTANIQGVKVHLRPMSAKTMRELGKTENNIDKLLIVFSGCVLNDEGTPMYNSPTELEEADLDLSFIVDVVNEVSEKSTAKKKANE